jgi:23S rRNA pseudouridine1911/1915/1917 synthase
MNIYRKGEWLSCALPAEHPILKLTGSAIDFEVIQTFVPMTLKFWKRLQGSGGIRVSGNQLMLQLFPAEQAQFKAQWHPIDVIYEDDFCMVVVKPAGMKVHPTSHGESGTLANAVAAYYEETGQVCAVRHIHRLDEDTSGAVLYAKNEFAHIGLDEAMREKRVSRQYSAIAHGHMKEASGVIRAAIGRDRHHPSRRRVSPSGDEAVTHYEVLEWLKDATLVELRLETGRTHQIRVHLSYLGHPLIGDVLYSGRAVLGMNRQALHGRLLRFPHPFTGQMIESEAPYPDDFAALRANLQKI